MILRYLSQQKRRRRDQTSLAYGGRTAEPGLVCNLFALIYITKTKQIHTPQVHFYPKIYRDMLFVPVYSDSTKNETKPTEDRGTRGP